MSEEIIDTTQVTAPEDVEMEECAPALNLPKEDEVEPCTLRRTQSITEQLKMDNLHRKWAEFRIEVTIAFSLHTELAQTYSKVFMKLGEFLGLPKANLAAPSLQGFAEFAEDVNAHYKNV